MKKQPAKVNYFFKDAYTEFWNVFKMIFILCGRLICDLWEQSKESFVDLKDEVGDFIADLLEFDIGDAFGCFFESIRDAFVFGFAFGRLIVSAILTPILCFFISLVQVIVVLLLMSIIYLSFSICAFADWVYRSIKKISTSCPSCQENYDLPTFVCTCGRKHSRLSPSKYGVLKRQCECGRKLKTTFFNGRHKQAGKWVCPQCGYELIGPLQIDIPIPVVGGPSAGKTCYINMAISEMEKNAEEKYNLEFEYKSNTLLGDDYSDNKTFLSQGKLPFKTGDMRMKYYQFYLTPKGKKVKNLVSLCDVAGETYSRNDEIGRQIGYRNATAFLILVDPLSLTKYREEVSSKIDIREYGASSKPIDEIINTLISTLDNMLCLSSRKEIKVDVAVVFTKCDIPGIDELIGKKAVESYMLKNNIDSKYDAKNKVCEQFLSDYEENNFLNILKSKFKSIQFFTCSSLGHVVNGAKFESDGVEDPALWLIDKVSASINLKNKWGRKI